MSKKRIFIISGLVIIFIAGCVLLVYDSYRKSAASSANISNSTSSNAASGTVVNLPTSYSIAVTEKGIIYSGQLLSNGQQIQLTTAQLNSYLIISTNNTHDFMTIICPSGYVNTAATTATPWVSVGHDQVFGTSATVDPNKQGVITVSCIKK
jgi:hypothetical protein